MIDTERHDCQPPSAESIGQIWTCPVSAMLGESRKVHLSAATLTPGLGAGLEANSDAS
jgi:hypothetical protein